MSSLSMLSGGAAQGLVNRFASAFKAQTGLDIEGEFGAVGAMADKLRAGRAADVVILTDALIAALLEEKLVLAATIRNVGRVETALAVRAADTPVMARDAGSLCESLLASDAIFVPDTRASTAGIHVAKVLVQLGIFEQVAGRINIYPNGATAMKHLAASGAQRPIGCTQATEIINTPGVVLSGALPPGCDLATMYTAAVTAQAAAQEQALHLIDLLTRADARALRLRSGFLDV
jgi:molybdate transport system substrate-binding protein